VYYNSVCLKSLLFCIKGKSFVGSTTFYDVLDSSAFAHNVRICNLIFLNAKNPPKKLQAVLDLKGEFHFYFWHKIRSSTHR